MTHEPQTDGAAAGSGPFDPAHARVLVVDDNVANLALMRSMLSLLGITEVRTVADATTAVDCFVDMAPDLVLLDLHMPGRHGLTVLEGIKSAVAPGDFRPVLIVTADMASETKQQALRAGARDFLVKPVDPVEATLRIRNLLEFRWLHEQLRRHNADLQARLDEHRRQAGTQAVEQQAKRERVARVLEDQSLSVVYQPIMELGDHQVQGYEALSRFATTPVRPPNVWFEEADDVGLGVDLELRAVEMATQALERLPDGVFVSINTSPDTAASPQLASVLGERPLDRVVVELTEHAMVRDYENLAEALSPLRRRGLRLAVDDTGSGFSSLRHILSLQPDIIKLDLALTRHIDVDPVRRALASALTTFAAEIGATLVAEGIESDQEEDALRRLRIRWGQGYFLGRPAPLP